MALQFTVGQLAALSHLSKQTLIYYDRQGVFCPSRTDPNNGYRYYTADQLEVLDSILILKEIGLSLAEIRAFMETRSEETALAALRQQHGRLTEKILSLTVVAGRLAHKIETLEHYDMQSGAPEWVYLEKPQPLCVQAVAAPGGLLEADLAIKKLFRKAGGSNFVHFYQIGTMIAQEDLLAERFLHASHTFLPLAEDTQNAAAHRPAGWHLRSFHKGSYESVGAAYRKMLAVLAANGCCLRGGSYEYCVLDSLTTKASAEYVTEIYLPVCREDGREISVDTK